MSDSVIMNIFLSKYCLSDEVAQTIIRHLIKPIDTTSKEHRWYLDYIYDFSTRTYSGILSHTSVGLQNTAFIKINPFYDLIEISFKKPLDSDPDTHQNFYLSIFFLAEFFGNLLPSQISGIQTRIL